ncbi:hypothetical protein E3T26_12950 [Cryobacterium sp. TMT1-21]|uniref:hypothetical protein n=1 Tax=Cryobacterium sp. TMT1-21 TaxID=1259234 RepID=UPI00106ACE41|nr:hypothetical protein [Cryobacterium sp. TMT1-21]TFD11326.1 hypothetical protein E3T26_12950 [Cryobacterium sp. TMT1-21]
MATTDDLALYLSGGAAFISMLAAAFTLWQARIADSVRKNAEWVRPVLRAFDSFTEDVTAPRTPYEPHNDSGGSLTLIFSPAWQLWVEGAGAMIDPTVTIVRRRRSGQWERGKWRARLHLEIRSDSKPGELSFDGPQWPSDRPSSPGNKAAEWDSFVAHVRFGVPGRTRLRRTKARIERAAGPL